MKPPASPPVKSLVGAGVGCLWVPLVTAALLVLDPFAPTWLVACVGAILVTAIALAGAFLVSPILPITVSALYLPVFVWIGRTAWSTVQPTYGETLTNNLRWLVPWYVGVVAGGFLRWRKRAPNS